MNSNLFYRAGGRLLRNTLVAGAFILASHIMSLQSITHHTQHTLIAIPFIPAAAAKTCLADPQLLTELNSGKPIIADETVNGKTFCVSRIIIKAKPEQIWQVLSDYKNAVHVFPLLKKCQVLEDHGSTKITCHRIAPSGIPDTYEYILEVHETAPKAMQWHRLSGDFKEVEGSWTLEPINSGHETLVTYSSHVTGGLFMPQMLIRRQAHIDMPSTMLALKTHTEHSIQIAAGTRNTVAE